ncbi:MAG: glycogen synthase GlgA [Halioglobus sp.]|nr:glycogen synthase GlgA [Halioglobus sp.]
MRALFVASEAYPLVKTGGLADVAGSLPEALRQSGVDVRLLLPAYQSLLETIEPPATVASLELAGTSVQVLECLLPGTQVITWLLRHPAFSERAGNPYHDAAGQPWPDNAERFMLLCRLAAEICTGDNALDWRPDVLHCNDWHTGPAIALAHLHQQRPTTVFTIHNLAHLGLFDRPTFEQLRLPEPLWHHDAMEFYGQFCFMKGGLVYADHITTVSPTYADEICEPGNGMGLEGLLSQRRDHLYGILNGIDMQAWDPADDDFIDHPYDVRSVGHKSRNKSSLQRELGLDERADRPLLAYIGRLAEQKGLDLLLPVVGDILGSPAQLAVLGTGDAGYERALGDLAAVRPDSMAVCLEYNESLAHRIEAGADIFLMPSLFEPCGLNQLYSLRYGTVPVVRRVGGLADTVTDTDAQSIAAGTATGFVFDEAQPDALLAAVQRALQQWVDKPGWRRLQQTGMQQDFSWRTSARQYLALYNRGH